MNKHLGIDAEVALRRILEGRGILCIRAAASHGICDVIALGEGDFALIEVKATTKGKFYASKSRGVAEALFTLDRAAKQVGDICLPVVAVYFAQLDEFRFYTPSRVLRGPVAPTDADLDLENELARTFPPRDSSPYSPPPLDPEVVRKLREIRNAAEEA